MNEIKSCEWCNELVGKVGDKLYHLNRKNNLKCLRIRYNECLAVDRDVIIDNSLAKNLDK